MTGLTPIQQKFILHWGEMGTRWGVNRTMAQIHALLSISPKPLHAEDIAETLGVARSNVSNSLRELQGWGIVKILHVAGDRRDHFETMHDVWEMFQIILDERKRREIDPTLRILQECAAEAAKAGPGEERLRERLQALTAFFETMTTWYTQLRRLPTGAVIKFVRAGAKVPRLFAKASGRH